MEIALEIKVTSTAFEDGDMLPEHYSCDGAGVSPPLAWSGIPTDAKSIAVVCEDPDAPRGIFTHWILYNLPVSISGLSEDVPEQRMLANGAMQGVNSARKIGYIAPCPPIGTHRYIFKVYALDTILDLQSDATRAALTEAMEDHILAEGQLMGRYSRS